MKYPNIGFRGTLELRANSDKRDALCNLMRNLHIQNNYNLNSTTGIYAITKSQSIAMYQGVPEGIELLHVDEFEERLISFYKELVQFYTSLEVGDTVIIEPAFVTKEMYPFDNCSFEGITQIIEIIPEATTIEDKRKPLYNGDDKAYILSGRNGFVSSACFKMPLEFNFNIPTLNLENLNIVI